MNKYITSLTRNRIITILITLVMIVSVVLGDSAIAYAEPENASIETTETGTQTNAKDRVVDVDEDITEDIESIIPQEWEEIKISSADELIYLARNCSLDTWSRNKYVLLMNDISLYDTDFLTIPTFGGVFDGQGHTISNYNVTSGQTQIGLFANVQKQGVIKNLNVSGRINPSGSQSIVGGIAGDNNGIIMDCSFKGIVESKDYVGGIAGINRLEGIISDCSVEGVIMGTHFTGGIVGENMGNIIRATNNAEVNTTEQESSLSLEELDIDSYLQKFSLNHDDSDTNSESMVKNDDIVDGEESVSEDDTDSEKDDVMKQDIHAKVFVTESVFGNFLYLGSMNASYNGANRNVELLVKLTTAGYYPETFLKDIGIDSPKSAFEAVSLSSIKAKEESTEIDYEKVFKQIVRMKASAKVKEVEENSYDVEVSFENFSDVGFKVSISPLFAEGLVCDFQDSIVFKGLRLDQLSMFYVITIDEEKRLCMIPTEGIPENRDKKIVTEIISNKKKLAEYIAFVLGDSSLAQDGDDEIEDGESDVDAGSSLAGEDCMTPIYERMLKAAYASPEKIKDVEYVIRLIDDEKIVTPEFRDLYNTFKSVLGI